MQQGNLMAYTHSFYDYFEERSLSGERGRRRRNVDAIRDVKATGVRGRLTSSHFVIWYYNTLEEQGRSIEGDHREAAWVTTAHRIGRYVGDPGISVVAQRPEEIRARLDAGEAPPDPDSLGPRERLHHYYRVLSAADLIDACGEAAALVALEVTEDWHKPLNGIVSPIPDHAITLGTHCVAIAGYQGQQALFVFPNSWGEEWGHGGLGAISPRDVDRFMVEGNAIVGLGVGPKVEAKSGKVILLWKSSAGRKQVHGRELVDAATGERLAWSFLVRRGNYLDIDELFVWPTHRQQGYGSLLAQLAVEAAQEMKCELRALVGFVDSYPLDRERLSKLLDRMGLALQPSEHRSLAYYGLRKTGASMMAEPRFPLKPASPVHKLDPAIGTRLFPVWYATNRKPNDADDLGNGFSSERDVCVHYGRCRVSIPKTHQFGSVGSSFFARLIRWTDDRLELVDTASLDPAMFWQELSRSLVASAPHEKQGLLYLHGYNNSFRDAAIRAAQIGYDLRFPGATAFYSWPSCGTLLGYPVDEATVESSEHFIAQFLIDFARNSGAETVHLIAHSMGNRALLRSLQRITASVENAGVRFGQIILAAPDLDCDTFRNLANTYQMVSQRTTLYVSRTDRAVSASQWLHTYPRVGLAPPVTVVSGIDTIEVPRFNAFDLLGHGYFADAEALLYDMCTLIRSNLPPHERQRLVEESTPEGLVYWVLER